MSSIRSNTHASGPTVDPRGARGGDCDGGLVITEEMQRILDQPGFISSKSGGDRLRNLFQPQWFKFNPNKLSSFPLACLTGRLEAVREAISNGTAPDITGTETPFKLGYVSMAVLGSVRISGPPGMKHFEVVQHLLNSGAPVDIPDVVGHTALHYACTPPEGNLRLARLLVEHSANVNAQNRYGEVPLFFPFQGGDVGLVELLLEHGTDLDIDDGNGDSPRKLCVSFGAEVTAAVRKWERKRTGEHALYEEKQCEHCRVKSSGLKMCARCRVVRYCSVECQRSHWKTHKRSCRPFSAATTVTLKPMYNQNFTSTFSIADMTREAFSLSKPNSRPQKSKATQHAPLRTKT